jgi:hypothetical protein
MTSVIIIGGGIAGLTVAQELLNQNYKVKLIERNDIIGGLARTVQSSTNKVCPYEYSWRAYGQWYQNVFQLMKNIPFDNKQTVFDKLTILQGGKKTCDKKIPNYQNTFSKMPYNDLLKMFPTILQYFSSCNDRNIQIYSSIGLKDYIHQYHLSKKAEDLIGKIVGPYLGFDYHHASVYDLLYGFEMMFNNSSSEFEFSITSLPTNFAWFEPWVLHLKKKGLQLHLNTEVSKININNTNYIENIEIYSKSTNTTTILKANYYVNCTGPEVLEKLIKPYSSKPSINQWYNDIKLVAKYGRQIQLSIYYYVDKKIFLENTNTLAYLPNTPWLLMVLPTGHIWGDKYLSKYCNKNIKEVISVGICEPYVHGNLIKKPWSKCTQKEIEIEAWHQLINDHDFVNNICVEDNTSIKNVKIIEFKMWDSYIYKNGEINTYEPKWANNVNTRPHRPSDITPISNLFLAGSYSNTSTGIYSMESAAESGKKAAIALCKYDNKPYNIYLYNKKNTLFLKPIRSLDCFLYKYNLTYIKIFILLILFILVIYIIIIIKNNYYKINKRKIAKNSKK